MSEKLIKHFRKYIPVDAEDEAEMISFFRSGTFAKKESLVVQNTKCRYHFFVVKGCLRMFYIDEKGMEQTIQFAIENWWITDYLAFEKQTVTAFEIQAVEKSDVVQIDYGSQEKLLARFPQLERYFRLIYQRAYAATQLRTKYLHDFSREQMYHHFSESFPEFAGRVPQQLLASYLNMTPEYLSEIKKKRRS
ncbi:Crp/Fnr family transcriptional regulator [Sediminibacterium soli]|uniref:Crp/Fnr family transcriptional regulator n=1 Tax=Sediminibacterium soli TaxID=2698829 RepID=UPI001379B7FA|nr:Crp/Fnr family transcriptional regulator [Sediminibacterium soli]NCI47017.1 Crp/Fnr family transcriptional regulator [Sediminibacterium soli]